MFLKKKKNKKKKEKKKERLLWAKWGSRTIPILAKGVVEPPP